MPKLRRLPFETAIIERHKRREASVEEALVEQRFDETLTYYAIRACIDGRSEPTIHLRG